MNDDKTKIATVDTNAKIDVAKKMRFGQSALHNRVAAAAAKKATETVMVSALPNRIGIMADDSGSMAGEKARLARLALESFITACDASNTAISIVTFDPTFRVSMTNNLTFAAMESQQLSGVGGTGLYEAMDDVLNNEPVTQCVIISDGEADNPALATERATTYKEAGIQIDCVHIGDSRGGEETLKSIASITGGMYIKFSNVENFAKNFKFLTPTFRAMLPESVSERAKLLGASEVK